MKTEEQRVKRTWQGLLATHEKLHRLCIPHNCSAFQREEYCLWIQELLLDTVNYPVYLFCHHTGGNN